MPEWIVQMIDNAMGDKLYVSVQSVSRKKILVAYHGKGISSASRGKVPVAYQGERYQ